MELRRIGNSGLKASIIGLGGNTFGATVNGDEAVAVIQRAVDSGVTFIDTADSYSQGVSEELVGRALSGRRDEVILATKVGWDAPERPGVGPLSRHWIMQAVEASLRRLRTEYVDLYQVHRPDPGTPLEETLRALEDLVHQGKVRYLGCSNFSAWRMVQALGIAERKGFAPMVSVQPRWNLLEGIDDPSLPEACRAFGIGIIPYQPLASGMLTGKYKIGEAPPAGTRFAAFPRFRHRLTAERLAAVERLRVWAEERGRTSTELAIAWLLAHPEVPTVIVGARSTEQVDHNVRAADWKLTPEEREEVEQLARS